MKKKFLLTVIAILSLIAIILPVSPVTAQSTADWTPVYTPQTHLDPTTIEQFVNTLPVLDAAGGTIQTTDSSTPNTTIEIDMKEFKSNMLPASFTPESGTYDGTWVWGYIDVNNPNVPFVEGETRDTYTGPVIIAARDTPSTIKYVNQLGTTDSTNLLAYKYSIDQSLHWANPNLVDRYVENPYSTDPMWLGNPDHYSGAIPAAVHVHGAEDPAAIDGGPDSWFTSAGQHGPAFYSDDGNTDGNYCIYTYPNSQEAAPTWFHDHTLGATRLNVYMGLAGGYTIVDPNLNLPEGLAPLGLDRENEPAGDISGDDPHTYAPEDLVIPLVVQDRMFDTNGQLFYNNSPASVDPQNTAVNPQHAYWTPEFFGDTLAVNGKVWPNLDVKAQRYEFELINGSNARSYILSFQNSTDFAPGYTPDHTNSVSPTIWQIATDQGYLDAPVAVDPLLIMPGERTVFILDFSGIDVGTEIILNNFGPDAPLNILPVDPADFNNPATTGRVMQFTVIDGAVDPDTSFDPSVSGITIRGGDNQGAPIVRLVDPNAGTLASGVIADLTRELTLVEVANDNPTTVNGIDFSGGPLEVLVNNTRWTGRQPDESDPNNMNTSADQSGWVLDGLATKMMDGMVMSTGNYISELPVEGTTEIWEIVNTTMDAHPIHTHLAQIQLMNRQSVDMGMFDMPEEDTFIGAYVAAFSTGVFMPGFGPPLAYNADQNPLSGGKFGGNPDVAPYLLGEPQPPYPNEAGWKDTVMAPPGMVTRFVVRWAPTDIPVGGFDGDPSTLKYAFVPNGPVPGTSNTAMFDYVWHCHIVDHEDNEMMRPDAVYIAPVVNAGNNAAISSGGTLPSRSGSFRASGAPPWTATVDFGDGTGTQPLALNLLSFTLPGHKYPTGSAIYTVTVTVTDGLGNTGSDSFNVTVTQIAFNPTTINLKAKGTFKVTIFGSATFNVNNIDQSSLRFGPSPFQSPNNIPTKVQIEDVNGDSIPDLLAFFDRPDSLSTSTTQASIWGTISGLNFVGTSFIKVQNK